MTSQKTFFFFAFQHFENHISRAWWKTSLCPNWMGIGSWVPEIWPHKYLISHIEISVNWPGSYVKVQDCVYCIVLEKMHGTLPLNGEKSNNPAPHSNKVGEKFKKGLHTCKKKISNRHVLYIKIYTIFTRLIEPICVCKEPENEWAPRWATFYHSVRRS